MWRKTCKGREVNQIEFILQTFILFIYAFEGCLKVLMFEIIGFGKPVRLIVGGLHGCEGIVTEPILRKISKRSKNEALSCVNLSKRCRYVSTINPTYYQTEIGKRLLSLIRKYKPEIYIELHIYRRNVYSKLMDPYREEKIGVPALIDLGDGILLGSVSPYIRTSQFSKYDLCLTFDIPSDLKDVYKVIQILNLAVDSRDRFEFLETLREEYPEQVRMAEKNFYRYFKNLWPSKRDISLLSHRTKLFHLRHSNDWKKMK